MCRNRLLPESRRRKREQLLAVTEDGFERIAKAVARRTRRPLSADIAEKAARGRPPSHALSARRHPSGDAGNFLLAARCEQKDVVRSISYVKKTRGWLRSCAPRPAS